MTSKGPIPFTEVEEVAADLKEASLPIVLNHSTAKNFEIRKVIIDLGRIADVRTAVTSGSDDIIEYWLHNDIFTITDPELIFVKDALGLSDNALQNVFNNANS